MFSRALFSLGSQERQLAEVLRLSNVFLQCFLSATLQSYGFTYTWVTLHTGIFFCLDGYQSVAFVPLNPLNPPLNAVWIEAMCHASCVYKKVSGRQGLTQDMMENPQNITLMAVGKFLLDFYGFLSLLHLLIKN